VHTALRRTTELCGPLNLPRRNTVTHLAAVATVQMILLYHDGAFIVAS